MGTTDIKIKEVFDYLYLNNEHLTSGQITFIDGLKHSFKRNKELSSKQKACLFSIYSTVKSYKNEMQPYL